MNPINFDIHTFAILSAILALLNLDSRAFMLFIVSRPIVVGPIIGLILNDFEFCSKMGVIIEFLWTNSLPIGGSIPFNATVTAGITITVVSIIQRTDGVNMFPLIFLFALILGGLASQLERCLWQLNDGYSFKFAKLVRSGRSPFFVYNLLNIIFSFSASAILIFIGILGTYHVFQSLMIFSDEYTLKGMEFIFKYLPLYCFVIFMQSIDVPQKKIFLSLGVIVGAVFFIAGLNLIFIFLASVILSMLVHAYFSKPYETKNIN